MKSYIHFFPAQTPFGKGKQFEGGGMNILDLIFYLLIEETRVWMSLMSDLKRVRVDSSFISSTIVSLEKEIVAYAKLKNSVTVHQY